jgi:hypothetical protein
MAHDQIEHGTGSRVAGKVNRAQSRIRDTVGGDRLRRDESPAP